MSASLRLVSRTRRSLHCCIVSRQSQCLPRQASSARFFAAPTHTQTRLEVTEQTRTAAQVAEETHKTGYESMGIDKETTLYRLTLENQPVRLTTALFGTAGPGKKDLNASEIEGFGQQQLYSHVLLDGDLVFPALNFGQDSFFVSPLHVGVADGVSGNAPMIRDPHRRKQELLKTARFSTDLMHKALVFPLSSGSANVAAKSGLVADEAATLVSSVAAEYADVRCGVASSTICVVALHPTQPNVATSSNTGDSGFIVIRDGKIVMQPEFTTWCWNGPNQVSTRTPRGEGHHPRTDGVSRSFDVQAGDIIISGSDGLWDNLYPEEVLRLIQDEGGLTPESEYGDIKRVADRIGKEIFRLMDGTAEPKRVSPFMQSAREADKVLSDDRLSAGKPDDICILCTVVQPTEVHDRVIRKQFRPESLEAANGAAMSDDGSDDSDAGVDRMADDVDTRSG